VGLRRHFKKVFSPQSVLYKDGNGVLKSFPLVIPHAYMTYMTMALLASVCFIVSSREVTIALFGWFFGIPHISIWCKVISVLEVILIYSFNDIEPLPDRQSSDKSAEQRDDPS